MHRKCIHTYERSAMTTTKTRGALIPAVHVTAQSGNAKTGNIPVTYRPATTCEPSCTFLPKAQAEAFAAMGLRDSAQTSGGCYGTGRIFGMASKFASTVTRSDVAAKLASAARSARFMRDRVVGDVVTEDGAIDHEYIAAIASLATDAKLIPFGYTHAWRRMNAEDVAIIEETGYVMNASCETREDVRAALFLGMPVTIASDIVADGETFTRNDGKTVRVVTCPAQTREDVTCASCGLCARKDRASVVRFNIHGTARKMASANVAARETGAQA